MVQSQPCFAIAEAYNPDNLFDGIYAEQRLLTRCYQAVANSTFDPEISSQALKLIQDRGVFLPSDEDHLISGALAHLANQPVTSFFLPTTELKSNKTLALQLSQIWLLWAANQTTEASEILSSTKGFQSIKSKSGAIDRVSLQYWLTALDYLLKGDLVSSKQLWIRSIGISGQFGTDHHPLIVWSFCSSFHTEDLK